MTGFPNLLLLLWIPLSAAHAAVQVPPPPPAGLPRPGSIPGFPSGAKTTLSERDVERALERFLRPGEFGSLGGPSRVRLEAGIVLAEQLQRQASSRIAKDIVDAFATVAGAPDHDDGDLRMWLAAALGALDEPDRQSALFLALRKRLSSRPGYLGPSFALRLLREWSRREVPPIYAEAGTQRWLTELRAGGDLRLAVQAWSLYLANAPDARILALCKEVLRDPGSRPAQVSGLILQEAGNRPALILSLRGAPWPTLFEDERLSWRTRRAAWTTWLRLNPGETAPRDLLHRETNPYLLSLFQRYVPRDALPPGASPPPAAQEFFGRPLPSRRLLFLIDHSYSMHAEYALPGNRSVVPIEQVERELARYLERLDSSPSGRGVLSLSVIFFAGGASPLLPLLDEGRWVRSNFQRLDRHFGQKLGSMDLYGPLHVAFRDTDADTIVLITKSGPVTGLFTSAEGLAREIATWNQGRGTRIVTLGPAPKLAGRPPGQPQVATLPHRLAEVTDGDQLTFEECFGP